MEQLKTSFRKVQCTLKNSFRKEYKFVTDVENSGKYDKVGDYDKRKKEIRKDARAQFNIILDLKTETDLKEALTDKVYAIYKAADFNPENVTEASLLDPETFNEEEEN